MYQKILVPVDGSATSSRGLQEAIKLAKLTGARLRLMHVVDSISFAAGMEVSMTVTNDMLKLMRESGEKMLAKARAKVEKAGLRVDTVLVDSMAGRVCDLVIKQAEDWRAGLIVLGTHGRRGVGRMLLGSDAEMITRLSTVPVLLVRAVEAPAAD
ncbi:MAG: universal stress protein [Rhizobacter sp.]|nr:universal stress protein [Burkholderiaceae bacterium]MCO5124258.1 universal stress protein [Rhizobacter sp.]